MRTWSVVRPRRRAAMVVVATVLAVVFASVVIAGLPVSYVLRMTVWARRPRRILDSCRPRGGPRGRSAAVGGLHLVVQAHPAAQRPGVPAARVQQGPRGEPAAGRRHGRVPDDR